MRSRGRVRRGSIMIETLVASVIVSISLAALVSMWSFSYRITTRTDDVGVACNLGRQWLEAIKQTGFDNTAEIPVDHPVTHRYDPAEVNRDGAPTRARYLVSVTVVSDSLTGGNPAPDSLRAVTVTVTLISTGEVLFSGATYLARSGI